MILEEIKAWLSQGGYQRIETNKKEFSLYMIQQDDKFYCICLVDDSQQVLNHPYLFEHLMEQTRDLFFKQGKQCRLLGIVVTDNIGRTKDLMEGREAKWLVDSISRKLIIFENQPSEFLDVRSCIEDICDQEILQGHSSGQSIARFSQDKKNRKTYPLSIFQSPVNIGIILINVIAFIWLESVGDTNNVFFMYKHGAIAIYNWMDLHEYWRLFTSAFLHFGFSHLLSNMIVLLYLGDVLERVIGSIKYLAVYLISAVGANIISVWWHISIGEVNVVSAGASGAIFGVVGSLLYIVVCNKGHVANISGRQLMLLSFFTIFHGFTSMSVDNSAHIGGLIVGTLCGLLFYRKSRLQACR